MAIIEVKDINKKFQTFIRPKGVGNAIKTLFVRNYETKWAVKDLSFEIQPGELVGYIGANGAGKSTTIKMLSGILVPDSGSVVVNGLVPYERRKENARNIGVVFGQRSQLNWDLPMEDTFQLYQKMYRIPDAVYRENMNLCLELLQMEAFLRKPVRHLSLGQRMRAELAIALLHDPKILFLDEPTIGLDVLVKDSIRKFIRELNERKNTTVILTTHDMTDIEEICDRVIMIDQGRILADTTLEQFKESHASSYFVKVVSGEKKKEIDNPGITCISRKGDTWEYAVDKKRIPVNELLEIFSQAFVVRDISIQQEPIDEIVRNIYRSIEKNQAAAD